MWVKHHNFKLTSNNVIDKVIYIDKRVKTLIIDAMQLVSANQLSTVFQKHLTFQGMSCY